MLLPQQIIEKKRDGAVLLASEIEWFVSGISDLSIQDSQVAAFAMAVLFQGMTVEERVVLTLAMRDSGRQLDWSRLELSGPVIDKHSTGGVGDVVSLMLGPMLAACGGFVPMVSGRGLGHTGGTVDKLESIPNYNTTPTLDRFSVAVKNVGVAIVGQTAEIAPADRRLYEIRDVTATVESIDLITASILSKKLAANLDALVMDVKVGNGSFMKTSERSAELAESIVQVAGQSGTPTAALLTDMNQCLARSAGNALEVDEAIRFLRGEPACDRLKEVTFALGSELLLAAGLVASSQEAHALLAAALDSGNAAERFNRMSSELDGPADIIEQPQNYLPKAPVIRDVCPQGRGFVAGIDVRQVGNVVVALGGGRRQAGAKLDHSVGLSRVASIGEEVSPERPLAVVHARTESDWETAAAKVRAAYSWGHEPTSPPPAIHRVMRAPQASVNDSSNQTSRLAEDPSDEH